MKYRAAVATLAAVPLALGLTACGNGDPKATGYRPSVPAESDTAALKSAPVTRLSRTTLVPAMNTALGKQKSWRVLYTMAVNGTPLVTVSGVQTAKPLAMSMDLSGAVVGDKTAKLILVDNVLYMSAPGVTPAGKYVESTGPNAARLRSMLSGSDPRELSKALSSAAAVKFTGTQSVGNETLDRYTVTVDTTKALKTMKQRVPTDAPKTLVYAILMDSAHRVRQLDFESSGLGMKITMTDYNKPVHITAPAASSIVK